MRKKLLLLAITGLMFVFPSNNINSQAVKASGNKGAFAASLPPSVSNIAKENTYPNAMQDMPYLQPGELAQQLIDSSNVKIDNPKLIHILNESAISSSPFSFGYRATIYLGHWALSYESTETTSNWEYQRVNTNYFDNRGGNSPVKIKFVQEAQKTVRGGLTAKIPATDDVQKMMIAKAAEKSRLPLSFETHIGAGTKKDQIYNIPPNRLGYLYAHAPAVNEKGKVTYGEVYLKLKGKKRSIMVKNVTSQGIGAWIPIQDHLSFSFMVAGQPK
ncbi:hypothetical protein D0469_12630 [Peribacillus saganii]|uniref:YfkD-like protein n=1 Tax=Peribacillus saganii TaxID=2303992 RepID=A0A372LM09_9BACI|nr:YfkD famly protein [Peribacillus saganii]RFU68110.1 hypothetical protein D0469_12630 [Peribacillus saganii]